MAGTWLATVCAGTCCTPPCTYTICARVETCRNPTDNDGVLVELLSGGSPVASCTTAESTNEVQQLKVTDEPPSAGNFRFKYGGVTSSTTVASNATASQVTTCLNTISALNGNVSCTGGPLVTAINIEFINALAGTNVALIEVVPGTSGSFGIVGVTDGAGGPPGSCCFSAPASGTYQLRASKTGYVTQTTSSFVVSTCGSSTITIRLVNATADLAWMVTCCLAGQTLTILDPDGGTVFSGGVGTPGGSPFYICSGTVADVDIEDFADADPWPISAVPGWDSGSDGSTGAAYLTTDSQGCRSFIGGGASLDPKDDYLAMNSCGCRTYPRSLDYSDDYGTCTTTDGTGSYAYGLWTAVIRILPGSGLASWFVDRSWYFNRAPIGGYDGYNSGGTSADCGALPAVSASGTFTYSNGAPPGPPGSFSFTGS